MTYDSATFPGYFSLKFSISSNGWSYWEMDTTIIVKPSDVEEEINEVPTEFLLSQNFPNPFNPIHQNPVCKYSSNSHGITLKVYDVLGNEIATLVNEEKEPGSFEVEFNLASGNRSTSGGLASGVYFYQLKAGEFIETKKMILLR